MKASEIETRKFYVREYFVREIVSEIDAERVMWRDYVLSHGRPIGDGVCSKKTLAKWAERVATPEEISRLRVDDAAQQQLQRALARMHGLLNRIPDQELLAEVRRRGLKLD